MFHAGHIPGLRSEGFGKQERVEGMEQMRSQVAKHDLICDEGVIHGILDTTAVISFSEKMSLRSCCLTFQYGRSFRVESSHNTLDLCFKPMRPGNVWDRMGPIQRSSRTSLRV